MWIINDGNDNFFDKVIKNSYEEVEREKEEDGAIIIR